MGISAETVLPKSRRSPARIPSDSIDIPIKQAQTLCVSLSYAVLSKNYTAAVPKPITWACEFADEWSKTPQLIVLPPRGM